MNDKDKQIREIEYKRISKRAKAGAHPVVLHVACEAKCEPIFKRCEGCDLEKELLDRLADLEDKIENGTLVEADYRNQKSGRWEKRVFVIFDSEKVGYRCSECNTTWDTPTPFCPNCGAMMKGGAE